MNALVQFPELETRPLTDWKNAPSLRDLKQDLQDAKPIHDGQTKQIGEWLDNLHVRGKAKIEAPQGNSKIVPKLIRKQAEWRYPALSEPFLSTDDVFNVRPVTAEDRDAALQNQLVLNHQFNTYLRKVRFIDEYVRAAVDEGTAIVRTGWVFEEEEVVEDVPVMQSVFNPMTGQIDQIVEYDKRTRMRTVKNHPTAEVCEPANVVFDPTCGGDIDKANFAIYTFEASLSSLEKEGKYKNLDRINVEASSILGEPDHATNEGSRNFNFSDQPRKKFVVHEYWGFWDIDGSGIVRPIVAAWVGNTMIRLEENPYPDKKLPFVVAQYLPERGSLYGEPDGALLEDNQKILGAVTRGMIDIMGKSANGQTGIRKDMLDTTNRRKFEKGQDYEFNANVDPRQGIFMHTYPEIPASAQFMLQLQNYEAESLTGVKAFNQGISGSSLGDVAAGIRGALDAASKRELAILRRLSEGIIEIGRKFISMNAVFLSDQEVVRITNEEFVSVRRDDLPGNFDLKLSISTAEEDNNKAQELAFMLQTMGNNMDPSMSRMILSDIARLRKMPDLAKKIEEYQPQPDPVQQKLQELEIAKIEAEIAEIRAKAMKLEADAQLSGAKIGTEDAKATHLKSDADLKNLDFVEQESGVKQERELQKHGEQARTQMQLKAMDHQFKRREKELA